MDTKEIHILQMLAEDEVMDIHTSGNLGNRFTMLHVRGLVVYS
jgi:hypothetical protein